jgi:hypothetical protein
MFSQETSAPRAPRIDTIEISGYRPFSGFKANPGDLTVTIQYRKKPKYTDTVDAPWILERAPLEAVVAVCPQRFKPFVDELKTLANCNPLP